MTELLNRLLGIPAAHAQVTFSATDANTALSGIYTGVTDFMWDNIAGIVVFMIVVGLVWFFARKIKGGAKGKG